MKILLTLDYELYFGTPVGTSQVAMIDATNKLLAVLDKFNAKAVFFVDATYLLRLKYYSSSNPKLQNDYEDTVNHIISLESQGHQIQLHIHPHWMNSTYEHGQWNIKTNKYRLIDWDKGSAEKIIGNSVSLLNSFLTNKVFAFRAGGWCIQPFSHIANALKKNDIFLDSTVFNGGISKSNTHFFDFTFSPNKATWKFDDDPCIENTEGFFTEIAISSRRVNPVFYWRFAFIKLFGNQELHRSFGDGRALKNSQKDTIRMLSSYSNSVVSVDGYKSSYLLDSYIQSKNIQDQYFVVIGHPKALSEFSLKKINEWLYHLSKDGNQLSVFETR